MTCAVLLQAWAVCAVGGELDRPPDAHLAGSPQQRREGPPDQPRSGHGGQAAQDAAPWGRRWVCVRRADGGQRSQALGRTPGMDEDSAPISEHMEETRTQGEEKNRKKL